jgi:hypothetical protein
MAVNRYVLISSGAVFQFCLSQTVATNLLISNVVPIIMMGITAAAKIAVRPTTE